LSLYLKNRNFRFFAELNLNKLLLTHNFVQDKLFKALINQNENNKPRIKVMENLSRRFFQKNFRVGKNPNPELNVFLVKLIFVDLSMNHNPFRNMVF
jgi:hypothetical protein